MEVTKVLLLDADGVLIVPERPFSLTYAESRGLNIEAFRAFFKAPFLSALCGQADLKDLIREHPEVWHWDGDPSDLLKLWFDAENVRNEPLVALAQKLRAQGTPCYIATNQEKYRAQYLKDHMFKGQFDGFFVSSELGVQKPDHHYFDAVIAQLQAKQPALKPAEILFFDDSQSHVDAANAAGLRAHLYTGFSQVESLVL